MVLREETEFLSKLPYSHEEVRHAAVAIRDGTLDDLKRPSDEVMEKLR